MDPVIIATGLVALLKEAMAAIELGVIAGQIPVEVQDRLRAKIDAIRVGDFTGAEWVITSPASDLPHAQPAPAPEGTT